ncbi:MAG: YHS domain-containing protein [Phycisphaeraceae bacterium]
MPRIMLIVLLGVSLVASFTAFVAQADESAAPKDRSKDDKKALAPIQRFVGGWRGVGLPDRNRGEEPWGEEAQWAWEFKDGRAAIVFDATDARIYKAGHIAPSDAPGKPGIYTLTATLPDGKSTETFTGSVNKDDQLVFAADKDFGPDRPAQITIRTVAQNNRLLVLYSRKNGNSFAKIAEVGYTRKGSNFASKSTANECIVTGGEGDIKVEYKGKSYYVCCKGCLDAFKDEPDKVMAEYQQKKAEEAKKKAK